MALGTYADLLASIADWLKRDELTNAIPDFVTLAESEIYRRLRVREMETALSATIASGTIPVPSDYTDLMHVYLNTDPICTLERKPVSWLLSEYPTRSADARPAFIAREASTFIFGPFPDSDYAVKGIYYKRLAALSSSLNSIFTNNPGVYLFGSLLQAEPYSRNDPGLAEMIPVWKARFEGEINGVQDAYEREKGMPGRMAVRGRGSMP